MTPSSDNEKGSSGADCTHCGLYMKAHVGKHTKYGCPKDEYGFGQIMFYLNILFAIFIIIMGVTK